MLQEPANWWKAECTFPVVTPVSLPFFWSDLSMGRNPVFDVLDRLLHHQARKPPVSASNREFLERFREIVMQHRSDTAFTTQAAATSVAMSRMHLNRKLRALTGQSTHEFIRTVRLEAARDLLQSSLSVERIAESVGFKSSSHFAEVFRERFGARPSTYRTMKSLARQPPRGRGPTK